MVDTNIILLAISCAVGLFFVLYLDSNNSPSQLPLPTQPGPPIDAIEETSAAFSRWLGASEYELLQGRTPAGQSKVIISASHTSTRSYPFTVLSLEWAPLRVVRGKEAELQQSLLAAKHQRSARQHKRSSRGGVFSSLFGGGVQGGSGQGRRGRDRRASAADPGSEPWVWVPTGGCLTPDDRNTPRLQVKDGACKCPVSPSWLHAMGAEDQDPNFNDVRGPSPGSGSRSGTGTGTGTETETETETSDYRALDHWQKTCFESESRGRAGVRGMAEALARAGLLVRPDWWMQAEEAADRLARAATASIESKIVSSHTGSQQIDAGGNKLQDLEPSGQGPHATSSIDAHGGLEASLERREDL